MSLRCAFFVLFVAPFFAFTEDNKKVTVIEVLQGKKKHDDGRITPSEKGIPQDGSLFERTETLEEMQERYKVEVTEEEESFNNKSKELYGVDGYNKDGIGEVNLFDLMNKNPKMFHDESVPGNPNHVGNMPEECKEFAAENADGITFIQPSNIHDSGAVLFGGKACSGVKRRDGQFNNWPSGAVGEGTPMTPDGVNGKSSANFKKGSYGTGADLKPIWLGNSGAVQIHSLSTLTGSKTLAGVSSRGCLVVNQDCMKELNAFIGANTHLKFKIFPSQGSNDSKNDACTQAVNGAALNL